MCDTISTNYDYSIVLFLLQCVSKSRTHSLAEIITLLGLKGKSIWYHTDALGVGFRVVRPLFDPSDQEKADKWEKTAPEQKDAED